MAGTLPVLPGLRRGSTMVSAMEGRANTAVYEPVAASTAFEGTVERLGTAIKLGLLAPGERLPPERELACAAHHLALDPADGAAGPRRGRLPRGAARTRRRHLRRGRPPAATPSPAPELAAAGARSSTAGSPSRRAPRSSPRSARRPDQLEAMRQLIAQMAARGGFRRVPPGRHPLPPDPGGRHRHPADRRGHDRGAGRDDRADPRDPASAEVLAHANRQHGRLVAALEHHEGMRSVRLIEEHLRGTEHILAAFFPTS